MNNLTQKLIEIIRPFVFRLSLRIVCGKRTAGRNVQHKARRVFRLETILLHIWIWHNRYYKEMLVKLIITSVYN